MPIRVFTIKELEHLRLLVDNDCLDWQTNMERGADEDMAMLSLGLKYQFAGLDHSSALVKAQQTVAEWWAEREVTHDAG